MKQGSSVSRESKLGTPQTLQDRIQRTEARHRELEARLQELGRRAFLTPAEKLEATSLKKHKLKAKDEIDWLRKSASQA